MASFGISTPWTRQPQAAVGVDWGNPITSGLSVLLSRHGGALRDWVSNAGATADGSVTRVTRDGLASDYANTQSTFAHQARHDVLGELTIAALVHVDALTNYSAIISKNSGGTTAMPFEFRLSGTATDGVCDLLRANTTYRSWNAVASTSGPVVVAGARNFIAVAAGADISARPTYLINGVEYLGVGTGGAITGNGTGTGAATSNQGTLYAGKRSDGITYLDGGILFSAVWARKLTVAELRKIEMNPWQLFAPIGRRIWVPSAGAATAPTLSDLRATSITSSGAQATVDYVF